jgi:transmembrane sensor
MTDEPLTPNRILSGTEAVSTRAADRMLARQMNAQWSDAEQAELDAWFDESTLHEVAYWRLEETWLRAKRLKALHSPMRSPPVHQKARTRPYIVGVTAIAIVGAVFIAANWPLQLFQPTTKTFSTPVGGHRSLTLVDGSKIDLNTDTTITVSMSAKHRSAMLEKGEALFSIRHDTANPFVASVGNHRVIDLGTQFSIRTDQSRVSIALIEESARFETARQNGSVQTTDMSPGDVIRATRDSMSVSKSSPQDLKNSVAWRRGLLVFHNMTFADAVQELNRYNDEKVVIADASVGKLSIGGTFFENDVHAVLNVAQQVFGLSVHKRGNDFVISR